MLIWRKKPELTIQKIIILIGNRLLAIDTPSIETEKVLYMFGNYCFVQIRNDDLHFNDFSSTFVDMDF